MKNIYSTNKNNFKGKKKMDEVSEKIIISILKNNHSKFEKTISKIPINKIDEKVISKDLHKKKKIVKKNNKIKKKKVK
jgi:hypothetical protein